METIIIDSTQFDKLLFLLEVLAFSNVFLCGALVWSNLVQAKDSKRFF